MKRKIYDEDEIEQIEKESEVEQPKVEIEFENEEYLIFWGETSGVGVKLDISNLKPERKIKYNDNLVVYSLPGDLVRVGPKKDWLTVEVWKDIFGIDPTVNLK